MPDPARAVLITRPLPAADETARRVAALGFRPVVAPILAIRPVAAAFPPETVAFIVTSANAVPGLPDWGRPLPLFAVGDATAARARAAGFGDVRSAAGDAQALAALILREAPAGTLAIAAGRGYGAALAERLAAAGRAVTVCVVYESVPATSLPDEACALLACQQDGQRSDAGPLKAALFFSAETARAFVRLVRAADLAAAVHNADACAIGRPAAVALEALPWRRIRIAAHPTQDEMLALLR